jgi:hypothetical protein
MPSCPCCGEYLPGSRDRYGARCRHCRGPLYERPEDYDELPPTPTAETSTCPQHPQNAAIGTCQRCGNFFCRVCRTRWREQIFCTACVERALDTGDVAPQAARAHFRNAMLGAIFGAIAWVLFLVGGALIMLGVFQTKEAQQLVLVVLGLALMTPGPFLSVFGVAHGASAVRARGDHMILATLGLILAGLHVGVTIGLCVMTIWQAWQE